MIEIHCEKTGTQGKSLKKLFMHNIWKKTDKIGIQINFQKLPEASVLAYWTEVQGTSILTVTLWKKTFEILIIQVLTKLHRLIIG